MLIYAGPGQPFAPEMRNGLLQIPAERGTKVKNRFLGRRSQTSPRTQTGCLGQKRAAETFSDMFMALWQSGTRWPLETKLIAELIYADLE